MFRRFALSALAAAATIGACSVYSAESPATDGFDASSDGNAPTEASASTDGGTDPETSGGDAGDAGDAGRFCERQSPTPTFCRDFDDGAPLFFGFDRHQQEDGGVVALDDAQVSSPPSSLLLGLPAGLLRNEGGFYVRFITNEIDRPGPVQTIRVAYDFRIDVPPVAELVRTGTLCVPLGTGFYCAWLAVSGGDSVLVEQEPGDASQFETRNHPLGLPLPSAKWTRVEMKLTVGSTPGLTLTFDGFDTLPGGPPVAPPPSASELSVGLNAVVYGNAGTVIPASEIRYDNVIIDAK